MLLLNSKIIDTCKDLIGEITHKKESRLLGVINEEIFADYNQLIRGTIKLLNSLQEGRHDKKLYENMAELSMFELLV